MVFYILYYCYYEQMSTFKNDGNKNNYNTDKAFIVVRYYIQLSGTYK